MLSATQIYTIFTVQLFAFLNLLPVEADIAAVSGFVKKNKKTRPQECNSGRPPVSVATRVGEQGYFISLSMLSCGLFVDALSWVM